MSYKKILLIASCGCLFGQSALGMEEERAIFYVGKDNKMYQNNMDSQNIQTMMPIPKDKPKLQPAESKHASQPTKQPSRWLTSKKPGLQKETPAQPAIQQKQVVNKPQPAANKTAAVIVLTSNQTMKQLQAHYQKEYATLMDIIQQKPKLYAQLAMANARADDNAINQAQNQLRSQLNAIDQQKEKVSKLRMSIEAHDKNRRLLLRQTAPKQQKPVRTTLKPVIIMPDLKKLNLSPAAFTPPPPNMENVLQNQKSS